MTKEYKQNTAYGDIVGEPRQSDEKATVTQNKYSLPYGLCAKYGIALPNGATPTDAWNALKGIGIKPSEVYNDLKDNGKVDTVKPTGEPVEESQEETKETLSTENIAEKEPSLKKAVEELTAAEKAQLLYEYNKYKYGEDIASQSKYTENVAAGVFDVHYGAHEEFTEYVNHYLGFPTVENNEQPSKDGTQYSEETNDSTYSSDDAYSQERKNNALWFKGQDSLKKSQQEYTPNTSKVWNAATYSQKKAAFDYTTGSGGFNRPLRGYQGIWGKYGYKGVGNVDLDYEGKGKQIKELTSLIDKSSYDKDIWLQHGAGFDGAKQFLGLTGNITEAKVKALIGKEVKDYGFFSCGASKGTGFSGLDCTFNVYCPAGTKMLYCAPFSQYNGAGMNWDGKTALGGSENEMLLQRQTTFKVTKGECKAGKWYFDIEVTKQEINDDVYKT